MSDIDTRIDDRSIEPATYDGDDPALEPKVAGPSAFLADLARAMQATVEAQRVQVVEEADARRKAHVEGIRAREDAGVEELREIASQDVKGIEIWATGEIERIRLERQRRVAARKADLERRLEDHHQMIEREVDAVERSVSGYREEVDTFFNGLDSESDPVLIARQAANLPPFPALELIGPDDDAPAAEPAWSAAETTPTSAYTNGSGPVDASIGYPAHGVTPAEDAADTTPDAEIATDDAVGDAPTDAVATAETGEAEPAADGGTPDESPPDQANGSADSASADRSADAPLVGVMDPDVLIGVESAAANPSRAGYIAPWDRHPSTIAGADAASSEELLATESDGSEAVAAGTLRIAPRSSGAVAHSGPTLRPIGSWLRRLNHS